MDDATALLESRIKDLEDRLEAVEYERDLLKAAIATPEVYVGVISDVIAKEREMLLHKLRMMERRHKHLRNALIEIDRELCDEHKYVVAKALKEDHE